MIDTVASRLRIPSFETNRVEEAVLQVKQMKQAPRSSRDIFVASLTLMEVEG